MDELEQAIGYCFKNTKLIETALTHTSFANESRNGIHHNERLEFLGDSVLSIVVSDYLFNEHKSFPEGELTRIRASLVCEKRLYEFAKIINLGKFIRLGKGEEHGGGRDRAAILADAFE
ncbi:MAG: ribonuclease III domain-containing protein, partial [Oscillospiraceae bacterium]